MFTGKRGRQGMKRNRIEEKSNMAQPMIRKAGWVAAAGRAPVMSPGPSAIAPLCYGRPGARRANRTEPAWSRERTPVSSREPRPLPERPRASRPRRLRMVLLGLFLMALVLWQGIPGRVAGFAMDLLGSHLLLEKPMVVEIKEPFPVKAGMEHTFSVPLKTDIPVRFPVKSVLNVPIVETFQIPLDKPFEVQLESPLRIRQNVRVRSQLPLNTTIETKIMGVTMHIPVKGEVPIDITFPLAMDLALDEGLRLHMTEPLPVSINKNVQAPVDFMVEGVLPLDESLEVPIQADMDLMIRMQKKLPLDANLDFSTSDLGQGVRLEKAPN